MKKRSLMMILLSAAFLLTQTILLSSCRNSEREAIEEEVAALREEVAGPTQPAGPDGSENQNETVETAQKTEDADPVSPVPQNETETEAHPVTDVTDEPVAASVSVYDTILSSEYTVQGGKLYFEAKAKKGRNTVSMPYFIDLTTLASDGLCPDPLCAHEDPAVCKYISMNSSTAFCFADDNTLYWVRQVDGPLAIYKYDLYSDMADKVYTPDIGEPTLLGADGGIVYFKEYEQVVGNGRSVMQPTLKGLDVSTDKIVFSVPLPEMAEILFIRDGKAWLNMMRTVTLLDLTSGRQTEICQIPGTLGAWYYDTADESFWFSTINQENNTGSVWEYKAGNCRQIKLPAENIYYFQLTEDRILYSEYNPSYLGVSMAPDHPPTYDYSGGKIWAVNRSNPSGKQELLYDAQGKYVISIAWVSNYSVFGNQLFFDKVNITHTTVEEEDGTTSDYVFFDVTGNLPKVHIDLTTGAEELISFD